MLIYTPKAQVTVEIMDKETVVLISNMVTFGMGGKGSQIPVAF